MVLLSRKSWWKHLIKSITVGCITVQAGYVGDDVESILHKLLASCNFQVRMVKEECLACVMITPGLQL
jgi:ATP-dependent protease Clp ATPase subunit